MQQKKITTIYSFGFYKDSLIKKLKEIKNGESSRRVEMENGAE